MEITLANTDKEISRCYRVIQELRSEISTDEFLPRIRNQEKSGYKIAFGSEDGEPVSVAGFRISENLAWSRFLYVDDLVTLDAMRSRGFGSSLLAWLKQYAKDNNCFELHLDSGLHRKQAHKFYEREKVIASGDHFYPKIDS